MNKLMIMAVLAATIAGGAIVAATASRAEDDDGGSSTCLNGPQGTVVKGDGTKADGMVYDATKSKGMASAKCANVAMKNSDDEDGDSD